MRYFFKQLFKTPMLLVFALMTLIFGFTALGSRAEVNEYAVVTALGVDKVDEELELSFLTFIPIAQQTFTEQYKVVTAKGKSIAEAIDFAGLRMGRQVGLSHIKVIVLNSELLNDDLANYIDFLTRNKQISTSAKLICCDSSAKEFLISAQKLDNASSVKISDLVSFNLDHIFAADSSLETYAKGTYGPTGVGFISLLHLEKSNGEGLAATMADSQGSGQSESGGQESKEIINSGDTAVLKDGKLVTTLNAEQMRDCNFLHGVCTICSIEIDHFFDKDFTDATLSFEIFDKVISYKIVFENGIPVVCVNAKLSLKLSEIKNSDGQILKNVELFVISKSAEKAIEQKVKQCMADGLEIMRDNNTDIVDFYTLIHNESPKAFKDFLNSLENSDEYLSHIVVKASVDVMAK